MTDSIKLDLDLERIKEGFDEEVYELIKWTIELSNNPERVNSILITSKSPEIIKVCKKIIKKNGKNEKKKYNKNVVTVLSICPPNDKLLHPSGA